MLTNLREFTSADITQYPVIEFPLSLIGFAGTGISPTRFAISTALVIVHTDIRVDNVLFDDQNNAILCDFSAPSPLGQPNPVFPDLSLPVNVPSPALSEASDFFAMGSLIFQMEHGSKLVLSVDSCVTLVLPSIGTDHRSLDTIIRKAWLGHYNHPSEMLNDLNLIDTNGTRPTLDMKLRSESTEFLRDRVRKWRVCREKKFGEHYP